MEGKKTLNKNKNLKGKKKLGKKKGKKTEPA